MSQAAQIPEDKWMRFWKIVFREIDRIEEAEATSSSSK